MRPRRWALAWTFAFCIGGSTAGVGCGSKGPDRATALPRLHTEGRFFKDTAGKTVILRGVAFADLVDLDTMRAPMNVRRLIDLVSDETQGWYARVVRFTVFPRIWTEVPQYLEDVLKPAVDHATERGLYAIIDWHEISDAAPADQETRDFWARVAPAFADYRNVLYELFNESEDFADPSWASWKARAQPWVDQIRRDAPDTVILIGAPMWTQAVGGAETDPFDGQNLAYVGHIYPTIDRQLWGPGGAFTRVAATRPMMITEWGYRAADGPPATGDELSFGRPLKQFIEEQRLGWTAWCADTVWGPVMFDPSWNLLTGVGEMGGFAKDWLAEKRDADRPTGARPSRQPDAGGDEPDAGGDSGADGAGTVGDDADGTPGDPDAGSIDDVDGGCPPTCPLPCPQQIDEHGCPICVCANP